MTRTLISAMAIGPLAALAASCVSTSPQRRERSEVGKEATHWIQDARLRAVMAEMDREASVSWPQEVEEEYTASTSARAARILEEACWLADGLAKAADRIPEAVSHIRMSEVDQRSFFAQVATLHDQAVELGLVAGAADLDAMRRVLTSITATCNSCHKRFRDFAGTDPTCNWSRAAARIAP